MALARRTESSGGSNIDYENLEVGEHDGRLVMVADLGLQRQEYKGEYKGDVQQIALGIEILGETITIDDAEQPRLMWTRPMYIYSTLTPKGKELEFYSIFDPSANEGELPDWDAQLGKPCTVNVEHVHKDDKTYDNVKALLPIPVKYQDGVDPATMEMGVGDSDEKDNPVNKALFGLAKYVFDKRVVQTTDPDADTDGGGDSGPY